jgi:serine/threonine protein kinase
VLLAEDGPRVIDFGISRAAEATMLTSTGVIFGSPAFMSPEQAKGHRVGPPSDVFSLGAVLIFAAAGQGPFGTGSSTTLMYRIVFTPPDTSGLPAELRPLVERCLAKDPKQRPTTKQILAELDTAPPAAGWLPAAITQAFPSLPPSEPDPAEPTAVGGLSAPPVTQTAAAPRAGVPESEMPAVTLGDMLPLAAAGTEAPGGRGEGLPGHSHLALAGAASAVALIIIYLIVAVAAHLPPFSKASSAPSSPAPATTAPASTGPRPSPVASSPATSPATSPVTSRATSPATSTATSPVTPPTTSPATSPAASSPAISPATSPAATPAASSPVTSPTTPPATSPPATSPAGSSRPGPG